MEERKVILSEQLFNKMTAVITELPYKNVGGLIDEIKAELAQAGAVAEPTQEKETVE